MFLWGLLLGGNANNGSNAGLGYTNSNNTPSDTNANIGSRNCLRGIIKICKETDLATQEEPSGTPAKKRVFTKKRLGRETENP